MSKRNIDRHVVDQEVAGEVEAATEEREMWSYKIEDDPSSCDMALSALWVDVLFSVQADPKAEWLATWEATVMAMQMHHAVMVMGTEPPGADLEFMINHQMRRTKGLGPGYYLNASNWPRSFFFAVVCRDHARVEQLCGISVELLREAGESRGTEYNEFTYRWIGALQAFV